MTTSGWLQIILYFIVLLFLVKPVGSYMAGIYQGETTFLSRFINPLEQFVYKFSGVHKEKEMDWKTYAGSLLFFSFFGIILLFILQRIQHLLPLNPGGFQAVPSETAFHTAISFVTNTNWQNYAGESTMSNFTQMAGLTVQNFLSAAVGMSVAVVLIRSFVRQNTVLIGNFWVDLTRSVLYILLPASVILAIFFVSQGVVQTFSGSITANLIQPFIDSEGRTITRQTISVGPVASQLAIKHLGTNGGGFFNANSAHPFENPNALTNFILLLAESIIPASLAYTFGKMVKDTRQGWAVLTVMMVLLFVFSGCIYAAESAGNPVFSEIGADQIASFDNPGGNMEGKEVRFGIAPSALFAAVTTSTSTGAVNSMHDSYTPLGGMILLLLMQFGEVILGGAGSGLYGILIFVILSVFIAGLMVGHTPQYLGKKIEPFEMKMAALMILIVPITILGLTALASVTEAGQSAVSNPGPHGFSQILYSFTSQANNNGSAFAGLSGNTTFYNLAGAAAMLIGRFWLIIPTLALAGSLANKKKTFDGIGMLDTASPLFIGLVILIVIIFGALNFVPSLALGPVIEHLIMTGVK